jgi:hypothetical protein
MVTSSTVKLKKCADVVTMQMQVQIFRIQLLQEQIFTNYQLIMAYLESSSTTIPSKKENVLMIMEQELVEESKIGSVTDHAKKLVTMISTAMPSRLDTSHAISSTQLIIGKEIINQIIKSL